VELLADESCAGPVIRALRAAGHDLVVIAEVAKGASDELVMERAFTEGRILITEDAISASWCMRPEAQPLV
jgi:predicted nuclease of predicted toxin-antitoxin system